MFRLMALLCGVIFLVLLIGGQDRGQVRQGLMARAVVPDAAPMIVKSATAEAATAELAGAELAGAEPAAAEPAAAEPDVTNAVFIPAQPVRIIPVTPVLAPVVAVAEPTPELSSKPAPETLIAYVDARSVNVRAGPSTDLDIVGRLTRGESVLVVQAEDDPQGWTLIRIEGDGIEGYVASRLLTDREP